MSKELLQKVIDKGVEGYLNEFFLDVSKYYTEIEDDLSEYDGDGFSNFQAIGEINFSPSEKLIVVTANITGDLTERTGKKAQYEKAKKIIKKYMRYDAGIFVFSDPAGNFRLSLVYGTPDATRMIWSNFRRFTYFVSKELTNNTFKKRIGECSFSSLEIIKDAFSVEKVTKLFYSQIADWYFWSVKEVTFPKDAEAEPEGRNVSVIRLITRLIFIWFMKERGLVSPGFFDKQQAKALLKSLQDGETTYYKAILQNLFFATLNTKIEERNFRFKAAFHGKNDDYMDHTIYRYETYFKNQETMLELFKDIPFLNGGLFDCLDRRFVEDGKNAEIRIDGFSDKEVGLSVPNKLFFSDEIEVDLNEDYGTINKRYRSQGLLNILSAYNFTIDENDPNDQEVALDPELLGKVFENLLASYNPETATTARKATGSYYTPREIVDYMVTESLKQYFKTHLQDIADIEDKLGSLFSTSGEEPYNPFGEADTKRMVVLIDDLRIVDPAVGSGAFPMGILNKLVYILSKLDPDNRLWKETQLKVVEGVPDPIIKQSLKAQITARFAEKNANYGRKLYLIEKCIYGVDVQQIAIEIAKLRFFIALLVDEKIDKSKYNWGVEPLPNLDFKLMQGNSLISEFMGINLDADNSQSYGKLMKDELDVLVDEFQSRKSDFQSEADPNKKSHLKKTVENLIIKIFEGKLKEQKADYLNQLKNIENKYSHFNNDAHKNQLITKEVEELNRKSGFDLEAAEKQLRDFITGFVAKPFFAWKLYFAEVFQEKGGFDIVIANPPWVFTRGSEFEGTFKKIITDEYLKGLSGSQQGRAKQSGKINTFAIFILQGLRLLKPNGCLTYIIPNTFLRATVYDAIRKFLLDNCSIMLIVDLSSGRFDNVTASTAVIHLENVRGNATHDVKIVEDFDLRGETKFNKIRQDDFLKNVSFTFSIFASDEVSRLVKKIKNNGERLDNYFTVFAGGIATGPGKKDYIESKPLSSKYKPLIEGKDVKKYRVVFNDKYILYDRKRLYRAREESIFLCPQKLITQRIGGSCTPLVVAYDDKQFYTFNSTNCILPKTGSDTDLKYLLAILNSQLLNWYYYIQFTNKSTLTVNISKTFLEQLPIKKTDKKVQASVVDLVDQILAITKNEDYLSDPAEQATVKEFERRIDQMVYDLYGLTPEEITVVEGSNKK